MEELKKCPFCGGEAGMFGHEIFEDYWVACKECNVSTEEYNTKEEAIEVWNRRVEDAVQEQG